MYDTTKPDVIASLNKIIRVDSTEPAPPTIFILSGTRELENGAIKQISIDIIDYVRVGALPKELQTEIRKHLLNNVKPQ